MAETPEELQLGSDEFVRLSLVVSYDGSLYRGFAANDGCVTVESELTEALSRYCGVEVELHVAGRTDKGVHATGQVVSFDAPYRVGADPDPSSSGSLPGLMRSVNKLCKPGIAVRDVRRMPPRFHARFDAQSRTYRYTILNSITPDPFTVDTAWHIRKPMDLNAMRNASVAFIGLHDFSSFCRKPEPLSDGRERTMLRRIFSAEWIEGERGYLYFDLCGSAFCHQMVRSMVGTLADVGTGRIKASDVRSILASKNRDLASNVAPARGLCLQSVEYLPQPRSSLPLYDEALVSSTPDSDTTRLPPDE